MYFMFFDKILGRICCKLIFYFKKVKLFFEYFYFFGKVKMKFLLLYLYYKKLNILFECDKKFLIRGKEFGYIDVYF